MSQVNQYLKKPKGAFSIIDSHLREWTKGRRKDKSSPPYGFQSDPWLEWFAVTKADALAEFIDIWLKSRFMPGHDPIEQAADAARRMRLLPTPDIMEIRPVGEKGDETDYIFFLSVAGHLQVAMGDRSIMLPCDKLGALMRVSKMTISRYRRWAIEDKYLETTKAAKFRSKGRGDATEFRFAVERWSCLEEKAAKRP